jgi:hypothetical protein
MKALLKTMCNVWVFTFDLPYAPQIIGHKTKPGIAIIV